MRIGLVTDSLAHLPLDEMLAKAAEFGISMFEFGCGNWSAAPHLSLVEMVESGMARRDFLESSPRTGWS
jgi:sugar phosphate isomerase/epimerase